MRRSILAFAGLGAVVVAAACSDTLGPTSGTLAPGSPQLVLNVAGAVNTNFYQGGTCTVVNGNIYPDQFTVGVNGSPSLLTDGPYYIRVTEPDGDVLGYSTTANFTGSGDCEQLWALVIKTSDGTTGFDVTTNPGGEYQIEISPLSDYSNGTRKSDNFKIRHFTPPCNPEVEECGPPTPFSLFSVDKFYDVNADGDQDAGEPLIPNWQVFVTLGGLSTTELTPFGTMASEGDAYSVNENMPTQTNWYRTTLPLGPVTGTVGTSDITILFGNVCTGAGGGKTLGYWSNKNGGAVLSKNGNAILNAVLALPLRKANGDLLGSVSLANFQKWLLDGNATNMAYMLSVQLAAMKANVVSGGVNGSSLIYAPGTNSANGAGFATVNDVMAEAVAILTSNGIILSGDALRPRAEAVKTALDGANQDNSTTFVQPTPCVFTFPVVS